MLFGLPWFPFFTGGTPRGRQVLQDGKAVSLGILCPGCNQRESPNHKFRTNRRTNAGFYSCVSRYMPGASLRGGWRTASPGGSRWQCAERRICECTYRAHAGCGQCVCEQCGCALVAPFGLNMKSLRSMRSSSRKSQFARRHRSRRGSGSFWSRHVGSTRALLIRRRRPLRSCRPGR